MSPLLPPDSKIWQTRKRDEKSQARKNGGEQEKEKETKYVVCHSTQLKKLIHRIEKEEITIIFYALLYYALANS